MKNVLYLSYDGLTDPLGQSQIIPYLKGLAAKGYQISVISFEKPAGENNKEHILRLLLQAGIKWHPLAYTKRPLVFSTLYDLYRLKRLAKRLIRQEGIQLLHCRSYLTALIGQWAKRKYGTGFIFDMRGFWADERVEGGIWNQNKIVYKKIYSYFKKKEIEFFNEADHTISLTHKAKHIIHSWSSIEKNPVPITVIPCCVDTVHFDPSKVKASDKQKIRKQLGLHEEDKVLLYLGSIGTWYLLDEMLQYFKQLEAKDNSYKFLFVTKEDKGLIDDALINNQIAADKVLVTSASRDELPAILSLANLAVSFIMPSFSKAASSPTKLAELFSMGIPVICNEGVGDIDVLIKKDFNELVLRLTALDEYFNSNGPAKVVFDSEVYRDYAINHFSLENGVNKFYKVYSECLI